MIKHPPKPKGREAITVWNRNKILKASIEVIAKHGIAGMTITRVVDLANVARGLINKYFQSKDILLMESLKFMAAEYSAYMKKAYQKAGSSPSEQIKAIIRTDFNPKVLNQKNMGIWFAYRSLVRSKPEYLPYVETRETEFTNLLISLCKALNKEGNYNLRVNLIVLGLEAMLEGMWLDFNLHPRNYNRKEAIETCFLYLGRMFPNHYHDFVRK
jgi:AcrR family transcriptional regulator